MWRAGRLRSWRIGILGGALTVAGLLAAAVQLQAQVTQVRAQVVQAQVAKVRAQVVQAQVVQVRAQVAQLAPATTEDHLAGKGWWPTKGSEGADSFVGDSACAKCHAALFTAYAGNAMAHAAFHGSGTQESGEPASGSFQSGPYSYTFVWADLHPALPGDPGYAMEVKAGSEALQSRIEWTFGAGRHGQTYLLKEDGTLYEAQVSSFATRHLGLTPGHAEPSEGTLQHALGNRLSSLDAARCFSCHTTAWSNSGKLDLAHAVPGVRCEACHGPGSAHVAAVRERRFEDAAKSILNPAHFSPAASVDFCGACHRTSMDIVLAGSPEGVSSLRFQPHRLEKSRCWMKTEDPRLACVGCHNPHEALVHDVAFYDAKCQSCHNGLPASAHPAQRTKAVHAAPVCPKAKNNCTSCHMPKYEVPEMHSEFTDHFIRIVKADEPFPR